MFILKKSTDPTHGLHQLVTPEKAAIYKTTAWFVKRINNWFDFMTSRHPVMALSKKTDMAAL